MKFLLYLVAVQSLGHAAFLPPTLVERQRGAPTGTGSGPYPAAYTTDTTLTRHTIYAPKAVPAGVKLPVMVWGNGGCSANGLSFATFLVEIASHGFLVVASGEPNGAGSTTAKIMTDSIDWISAKAGSGAYAAVDASKIAAAGQSCGGIEAYGQQEDSRVTTIGIFNSGLLQNYAGISKNKKPTFFFLGGSSDIAYQNGERDYKGLPDGVPSWKGNLPVGHGGTYYQPNGGAFGAAAVAWLQWTLQGNATGAQYFTSSKAADAGWAVEAKNLDKIPTVSI